MMYSGSLLRCLYYKMSLLNCQNLVPQSHFVRKGGEGTVPAGETQCNAKKPVLSVLAILTRSALMWSTKTAAWMS